MSNEPTKRHYSHCECGHTENESKDLVNGTIRAYFCPSCSRNWEVDMTKILEEQGY